MSEEKKCTITYQGDTGKGNVNRKYARALVMDVTTDAAAQVLATALDAHTSCNVAFVSYNERTKDTPVAPAASADTGKKGVIYFRNSADLRVRSMNIPAPIAADLEDVGFGQVYKAASVATIVAFIATATGLTLTPLHGTFEDDKS